ncbi:alcohol dehydrogenase catalytic domain-containing protein [Yinghuangia aomiensis]
MAPTLPATPGNEFSGVLDALGPDVTAREAGDEVLGWTMLGAYAEAVAVPADQLVRKPAAMPWDEAAVLSASGQTAHRVLRELGVGAGDTVLVHAAAGGVGTFAVQLATAWGATVIGTASPANHDYVRAASARSRWPTATASADRVRAAAPQGVDAAFDAAGRGCPRRVRRAGRRPVADRHHRRLRRRRAPRRGRRARRPRRPLAGAPRRTRRPVRQGRADRAHRPTRPPRRGRRSAPHRRNRPRPRQGRPRHRLTPAPAHDRLDAVRPDPGRSGCTPIHRPCAATLIPVFPRAPRTADAPCRAA